MSNKIIIIDYNMGNLRSVQKAFEKVGSDVIITNDHNIIKDADKILLPGVGAFKDGMKHLEELNLIELLNNEVLNKKKPFLGICLGMQLLATKSYENGETQGLGWIDAQILKFDFNHVEQKFKVPHVGWNNVKFQNRNVLFDGINDNGDFYFVHSYYFNTNDKSVIVGKTDYGINFISSVQKNNIYACQFHPEKSQEVGLQLIKNFVEL